MLGQGMSQEFLNDTIQVIQSMFSYDNGIKLEMNNRKMSSKLPQMTGIRQHIFKIACRLRRNCSEIIKCIKLNNNENMTY
jgi:hypothetical protein